MSGHCATEGTYENLGPPKAHDTWETVYRVSKDAFGIRVKSLEGGAKHDQSEGER